MLSSADNQDRKVLTFQIIKVIAGILFLFIIPLEYLINESLSDMERWSMQKIQHRRTDSAVDFFKGLTYMGNHLFLVIVLPVLYHLIDARLAMKITIVICSAMYVHSFLALLYVEPRPFWYSGNIEAEICQSGFGSPALELMLMTVFFVYITNQLLKSFSSRVQIIAYSLCLSLSTLYFTAALYLGEHFPHQCLITLCYAFIFLTAAFALDKYISELTIKSNYGYNSNRKNSIYFFIATMVMFLVIISTNNLITHKKGIKIHWIKNALQHCSNNYEVNGNSSFYVSAWIFYMQGAVFGCMFAAKRLSMYWWMTSWWKRVARAVIAGGFAFGVYSLFDLFDFQYDNSTFVFNYVAPLLIISFVAHGIMPVWFAKIHFALSMTPSADDEDQLVEHFGGIANDFKS